MLDIAEDIQSLTTFRRRPGDSLTQLIKSRRPVVLTVMGKPAAVVQNAAAYQCLLDIAVQADPEEGIRGLTDARKRKTRPVRKFSVEFEARHGISRAPSFIENRGDTFAAGAGSTELAG